RTTLPAGPDAAELERWSDAGFDIAYRPRNAPYRLVDPGTDLPPQANYLIYAGTQVAGHPFGAPVDTSLAGVDPDPLQAVVAASQPYLTAVIEGTPQDGMAALSSRVPTVRLLS